MKYLTAILFPVFSTSCLYVAYNSLLHSNLTSLFTSLISLDFALQMMLGIVLFSLTKKIILFPLMQAILMGFFYLSTPIKLKYFSNLPFSPYDFPALISLIKVMTTVELALFTMLVVPVVILFFYNIKFTKVTANAAILVSLISAVSYSYANEINVWLENRYSYQVWNKGHNYLVEGGTLYFLHESLRIVTDHNTPPASEAVATAIKELEEMTRSTVINQRREGSYKKHLNKRNVHLIVVESFVDPVATFAINSVQDPFYPPFRKLYLDGGSSISLSPVYTGGTANAEFEILCGFPVLDGKIAFEYELTNESIPCLPRLLADRGYATIATHPNWINFWNRGEAYPRIGFQSYFHKTSFHFDDMNGDYLSDESLFTQNSNLVSNKSRPIFNYVLTISSHYPYQLSETRNNRKEILPNRLMNNYMNMIYYGTKELYSYIHHLQATDPDAVIMVVGDHSPYFGPNLRGYSRKGLFNTKQESFDQNGLFNLTRTPLLLIDGRNGPTNIGSIAHHEIPMIILSTLGITSPVPQQYLSHNNGYHMRPVPGYNFLSWNNDDLHVCTEESESIQCKDAMLWQRSADVLRSDLLFGRQQQLSMDHPPFNTEGAEQLQSVATPAFKELVIITE